MIDPILEKKIKQTKEFLELWLKFRQLYKNAVGKNSILPEEENIFLETKTLVARRYQSLIESLDLKPSVDDRTFDVIKDVLSLERVATMSDDQLQRIENDWHNSLIVFNQLLGGLENKRDEVASISSISVATKKLSTTIPWRKLFWFLVLIILVWVAARYKMLERLVEFINNLRFFKTSP